MPYTHIPLDEIIAVTSIVTIHYFEYSSDYHFPGEAHDFWEFLCVDKGEVDVFANEQHHTLSRSDIIFHKPNEFHGLAANHKTAPNLVVISFHCASPAMDFFHDRILSIDDYERQLLARIILEAKNSFQEDLGNPYQTSMQVRDDAPLGFGQIIRIHLSLFLLTLLRRYSQRPEASTEKGAVRRGFEDAAYHRVIDCMDAHLSGQLTLTQLAKETLIGRSQLQKLVRTHHRCGVIDLFLQKKTNAAKQMIRENQLNFTEISQALGYSSIHYFSRQFKKMTGMTPSEYSSSIQGLAEQNPALIPAEDDDIS